MSYNIGEKYDKIARVWEEEHRNSEYGIWQIEKAISYCENKKTALDVGCGCGGRITELLVKEGFSITGIDASTEMIKIAKQKYPEINFFHADICEWQSDKKFDLITAWDSIFHLSYNEHKPVLIKLTSFLNPKGIIIYTFGDDTGEHYSDWHNDSFRYSSIGINENIKTLIENNNEIKHLELDQYPEKHIFIIAKKL